MAECPDCGKNIVDCRCGGGDARRNELPVSIRWLIRRDMPEMLKIEGESFEFPWTDEDFLRCLRQRNCIGMVAEHGHQIVGFMVYDLHKARLHILNFAVAGEFRRMGVGTQMVRRLVDKLSRQRRNEILLEVRERRPAAQRFFRSMGFVLSGLPGGHYDDSGRDACLLRYFIGGARVPVWNGVNRIGHFYSEAGL